MIPTAAIAWAHQAQRQTGASDLAAALALALAGPESGYNPRAIGDGGASFGLMQFYTRGGLGDGHDPADLLDPVYNFRLGMSYIQARLNAGATPWEALQPWSTRDAALANLDLARTALSGASGESAAASAATDGAVALLFVLGLAAIVALTAGG